MKHVCLRVFLERSIKTVARVKRQLRAGMCYRKDATRAQKLVQSIDKDGQRVCWPCQHAEGQTEHMSSVSYMGSLAAVLLDWQSCKSLQSQSELLTDAFPGCETTRDEA